MVYTYSKLKMFQECPRKFEAVHLEKTHTIPPSPAMKQGTDVHNKLEEALKNQESVPQGLHVPPKFWALLKKTGLPEIPIAMTKDGHTCPWNYQTAILRGKIDVESTWGPGGESGYYTILTDWKTGNPKYMADPLQAKVYGSFYNRHRRFIIFVWQHPLKGDFQLQKINTNEAWQEVKQLLQAVEETTDYPPKPGPLCPWCPVTECEYYKERR